jgi:hypothetical protein
MMRVAAATSADTLAASHPRSAACTSCACAADATLPVPIAHTGSYATTMDAQPPAGTDGATAAIWRYTTSSVCPASRSVSNSPTHRITERPASSAACGAGWDARGGKKRGGEY